MPVISLATRLDTVLKDLEARKLGRFAPPSSTSQTTHARTPDQKVGSRCIILADSTSKPDGSEKRGSIRFVGETSFGEGKGDWIGIELDEPVGKNDGR